MTKLFQNNDNFPAKVHVRPYLTEKKRRSVVYAVVGAAVAFERAGRGLFPALRFAGFCYCVLEVIIPSRQL